MNPDQRIKKIAALLGYEGAPGYVLSNEFPNQRPYAHFLRQAAEHMCVAAAFGLRGVQRLQSASPGGFTPIVYLCSVESTDVADEVHKKIWNQGLVPFVIFVDQDGVECRSGFKYDRATPLANRLARHSWDDIEAFNDSSGSPLMRLTRGRLQSSIVWRDMAVHSEERVDAKLLGNLDSLCDIFISRAPSDAKKAWVQAANSLIGRMLFAHFLWDRGYVTEKWLSDNKIANIQFDNQQSLWGVAETWDLFEKLDKAFNGSIFPISEQAKALWREVDINDLRQILRFGASIDGRSLQFSFLNFDWASIRTETLSAIYELFLSNHGEEHQRKAGAFYTPPFLADYLLDKLEEVHPLTASDVALDCAAGSGVFLVGALRRIIESTKPQPFVPLATLHALVSKCIRGIEKDQDACHVAAFSLYLTLLDYVSPSELELAIGQKLGIRLFPKVIGKTLIVRDFFDKAPLPQEFNADISVVVGNPPWCKLGELDSDCARDEREIARKLGWPISNEQAALLFFWRAMESYLSNDGHLAMLLPAMVLLNDNTRDFREELISRYHIACVSDLTHLRKRLFVNSDYATAVLVVEKRPPCTTDRIRLHTPLLNEQPEPLHQRRKAEDKLWVLLEDASRTELLPQSLISRQSDGWRAALLRRAVDREVFTFIDGRCQAGQLLRLDGLAKKIDLIIKSGDEEKWSGVPRNYLLCSKRNHRLDYRRQLFGVGSLDENEKVVPLPEKIAALAKNDDFLRIFGGKIILAPRSLAGCLYVEEPIAFGRSFNAITFRQPPENMPDNHERFLRLLAAYMSSGPYRYMAYMSAPDLMLGRRRIEISTIKSLPVPAMWQDIEAAVEHPSANIILTSSSQDDVDKAILDLLAIHGTYRDAVFEFLEKRMFFADGYVPAQAITRIEEKSPEALAYCGALVDRIENALGEPGSIRLHVEKHGERPLICLAIQYLDDGVGAEINSVTLEALAAYDGAGATDFTASTFLHYVPHAGVVVAIKPVEAYHWSIEKSFADSELILEALFENSSIALSGA